MRARPRSLPAKAETIAAEDTTIANTNKIVGYVRMSIPVGSVEFAGH